MSLASKEELHTELLVWTNLNFTLHEAQIRFVKSVHRAPRLEICRTVSSHLFFKYFLCYFSFVGLDIKLLQLTN